jgi:hypothetical protein
MSAASVFISRGMSEKYGRRFELMLRTARLQAMALFPDRKDSLHGCIFPFSSPGIAPVNVVQIVNQIFSQEGYNPLYFSRRNILRVRENKLGTFIPLNKGATWLQRVPLDSS